MEIESQWRAKVSGRTQEGERGDGLERGFPKEVKKDPLPYLTNRPIAVV